MLITKGSGEKENFNPKKLEQSLKRAGADSDIIKKIITDTKKKLYDGITTSEIYNHAFSVLKKEKNASHIAARYSLRRAVMALGPTGFAFEKFLAEIFSAKGYKTQNGVEMAGKCVNHEIDVVAEKEGELILMEAKFHNKIGFKSDLKVALYIHSRARDLYATNCGGKNTETVKGEFWLVTNTKFTKNAIDYGKCACLKLVGWNYPRKGNLQDLIEETALHPITCLTTISEQQRNRLLENDLVLCRDIKNNVGKLEILGIKKSNAEAIVQEARNLCIPRKLA